MNFIMTPLQFFKQSPDLGIRNEMAIKIHQTLFQKTSEKYKSSMGTQTPQLSHIRHDAYLLDCYLMQGFLSHTWKV